MREKEISHVHVFLGGVQRTGPGSRRLRRLEPQSVHGRSGEGDSGEGFPVDLLPEPHVVILLQLPDNRTVDGVDNDPVAGQIVLSRRRLDQI